MDAKHVPLSGNSRDPHYYETLCHKVHVHRGAFIISIVGMVFSVLSAISTLVVGTFSVYALPGPIISFILFMLVCVGNKKDLPGLYLPYIILSTIGVVLMIGLALFIIFTGGAVGGTGYALTETEKSKKQFTMMAGVTIASGIILLVWGLINAYFIHVIYRAYRYLKDVVLSPTVALTHAGEV